MLVLVLMLHDPTPRSSYSHSDAPVYAQGSDFMMDVMSLLGEGDGEFGEGDEGKSGGGSKTAESKSSGK